MSPGIGIIWALIFSVIAGGLSAVRSKDNGKAAALNFGADIVILFFMNSIIFYSDMPSLSWRGGLLPLIIFNLLVVAVVASVVDFFTEGTGAALGLWLPLAGLTLTLIVWHNTGHDAHRASHLVNVKVESTNQPPPSSTAQMTIISPDIAATRASASLGNGLAGQRNYNTFLELGPATLQEVRGKMWYVFPLHFDGSGNKHRLHNIEPGYVMVSAVDSDAHAVERYDGEYSMKVCQDCGQSEEITRWVYQHGYRDVLDDPTLEVDDQGHPYWTLTIDQPQLGRTFYAPTSLLVVNAHTGAIKQYALNKAPAWIDRVYSQNEARTIATWYGNYSDADFKGWWFINRSNANRLHVPEVDDPILVYTGAAHPEWRITLTSYNHDTSVSRMVFMDAHSGAMRVYSPKDQMNTADTIRGIFEGPSGVGATNVKTNGYHPSGFALHVIYGHLTWMTTYEQQRGQNRTFAGVGFVDAYQAQANHAVFGSSLSAALQNYLTQLAAEPNEDGNAPGQGSKTDTVSGTVNQVSWDMSGNQKFWYITLVGDPNHIYVGVSSSVGPAIILVQHGDPVTLAYLDVGSKESQRNLKSFTDANVPLSKPGS